MKTLTYLFLGLLFTSCNGQVNKQTNTTTPNKQEEYIMKNNTDLEQLKEQGYALKKQDTIMMKDGKLDIETIVKNGTKYTSGKFWDYNKTLDDGTQINVSGDNISGYSKKITKKNSPIIMSYGYHSSGELKQIAYFYPNRFSKGTWYWYNQQGQITRLEEYDKRYEFTWEDVLIFIQEKEIKKEKIYRIFRDVQEERGIQKPYWYISKTTAVDGLNSPTSIIKYTLNGTTGKVLKEETEDVTRHLE
ncbi:MAG: hypothetical protein JKY08_03350 [Flavobacteriaceae bacterium]|nr:hypothetical protein [Flavobacteriaceae bacterium]